MADIVLTSNATFQSFIIDSSLLIDNFNSSIQIQSNITLPIIDLNIALSGISESKIIIIGTNALGISEKLSSSITIITLVFGTIDFDDEILSSSISFSHIINGWLEVGVIEILSSSIAVSSTFDGYINFGDETALSSTSKIISELISHILIKVRCINCSFNDGKSLTKNGPKCFRNARFQKEILMNECSMYKKIKGL